MKNGNAIKSETPLLRRRQTGDAIPGVVLGCKYKYIVFKTPNNEC